MVLFERWLVRFDRRHACLCFGVCLCNSQYSYRQGGAKQNCRQRRDAVDSYDRCALSAGVVAGGNLDARHAIEHVGCAWFAASGLLATVWGRLTLFKAVLLAGVIRATTIRRLTPFFTALLAWALLGETIPGLGALGMVLMAASFALLYADNRQKLAATELFPGADIPRGYMFGAISALMYAASYVVRKQGLEILADPYFGALVGSAAALVYYIAGCFFSSKFRTDVRNLLSRPDRWQLVAAFCISAGQILQFVALNHAGVGRVAIINSVEIFLSSYLAVIVFKTEKWPSAMIILATVLATAGVIFVAAG
jgi:drug/metabolite transporter (DMT)-like permease